MGNKPTNRGRHLKGFLGHKSIKSESWAIHVAVEKGMSELAGGRTARREAERRLRLKGKK